MLPNPVKLEKICKGLATLDAIMSEDWDARYYSFNAGWNVEAKQRMASMRNGSGDEWFIVFQPEGTFVKAFWHEFRPAHVMDIYAGLPLTLTRHTTEAAFSMDFLTFGGWHDGTAWTLRGDVASMAGQLEILSGDPEHYRRYAVEYFEKTISKISIGHVLVGKPLDEELLESLGSERTLLDLAADLAEIGYAK